MRLSSDTDGLQADYELGGTLRSFQSEYRNGVAQVVISLDARLVDTATRRIVSGRRFTVIEAVKGVQVSEVVVAFGSANDALARGPDRLDDATYPVRNGIFFPRQLIFRN